MVWKSHNPTTPSINKQTNQQNKKKTFYLNPKQPNNKTKLKNEPNQDRHLLHSLDRRRLRQCQCDHPNQRRTVRTKQEFLLNFKFPIHFQYLSSKMSPISDPFQQEGNV